MFCLFWERCDEAREGDFLSQLGTGPKERANDNGYNLLVSKFGSLSYSVLYGKDVQVQVLNLLWEKKIIPKITCLGLYCQDPKSHLPQALGRRNNRAEFMMVDSPTWLSRNGARFTLKRQYPSSHALCCHLWFQTKLKKIYQVQPCWFSLEC